MGGREGRGGDGGEGRWRWGEGRGGDGGKGGAEMGEKEGGDGEKGGVNVIHMTVKCTSLPHCKERSYSTSYTNVT